MIALPQPAPKAPVEVPSRPDTPVFPRQLMRRFTCVIPPNTLVVWLIAGAGFGAVDVAVGGSAAAGALIAVMVAVGGLSASALTYLAVEWMMRPVIALALASDPAERPRSAGIATRIYLAWEFGTAAAVCGAVVAAIAYLAGGGMSPRRMAATVIFLGAIALAVGLVTLLVAIRSVAHPVRGLRNAMARVEAGDNNVRVPVDDGGEVGLLQAGFNRMGRRSARTRPSP
jgi:adenylate cyclase